jgi:hypothetical protein
MTTIIEFALFTIVILLLIIVPLALIAGGLASRAVVIPPDTSDSDGTDVSDQSRVMTLSRTVGRN